MAHQHDVCLWFERGAIVFESHQHLTHNFAGGEVANQAERGGQAETAIDCAARLRRNADGLAILRGHEDRFDGRLFYGGLSTSTSRGDVRRKRQHVADGAIR